MGTKPTLKNRQATLMDLRVGLDIPTVPTFETIWLAPQDILVDGTEEERLDTDADKLVISMQLFGLGQAPAVTRELYQDADENPAFRYRAVYGRRRILAARDAGLAEIEVHCYVETLNEVSTILLTLVENLNRRPAWIQTIAKVKELLDLGWSEDRLLDTLKVVGGVSSGTIASYLQIAHLHPTLLREVLAGRMAQGVAAQLAKLTPDRIAMLVTRVEQEQVSVTGDLIRDLFRVQVAPVLQGALIEETPPAVAEAHDREGLAAQFQVYDAALASQPRYAKARMLLGLLVKELAHQEEANDAR